MHIFPGSIVYDNNSNEYEVQEPLGDGAFGIVYKIKKKPNGDIFALKSLLTSFNNEEKLKAFINEGNLALKVNGTHIITYHFFHDGQRFNLPPYIIMEYANDGTLSEKIETMKNLSTPFTNDMLRQYFLELIDGMTLINEYLIHRDIKPDNILISNGILKISDFGLSKIVDERTRSFTFKGIGCLPYLAPEGWEFEKNTIKMDIYSMGIVFYQISTLRHPLNVPSNRVEDWKHAHLFQKPKQPSSCNQNLTAILDQLIMKMIEKSSNKRFGSWKEIKDFLEKDELPGTNNTNLINVMLQKQLDKDNKEQEKELKKQERKRKIDEDRGIIEYQIDECIFTPLKEFIDEFNYKYKGNKIQFSSGGVKGMIQFPSGSVIIINFEQIIEENFIREKIHNSYSGNAIKILELNLPKLNNRTLMAWGLIKANDGRGYNIVLVKNDDGVYGDWFMFINHMNIFNPINMRLEPFPFEFNEIEREMLLFHCSHIYRTEVKSLDIDIIKDFISKYMG